MLPAERLLTSGGAPPDAPFALVETQRGGIRLVAVDAAAQALGLAPGLTLADARARVPELVAIDHQPAADAALLGWLADACDRYSPSVATDPPQGLVLDISGCSHPYGDAAGLADDLARRLARHGLTARLATGDTPDAALALARFGAENVRALPVAALRVDAEAHLALRRAGLRTIGDLAVRPRAPLAARFGTVLPTLLAQMLGEADPHIVPRRTPPAISAEARLAEPVAHSDHVLQIIDRLVVDAGRQLVARGCGGRRFDVALFRADGHVARLGIETGAATRDPAVLARLFRERIDALADPLDPGFGYDLIRLAVPVVLPMGIEQLRLDGGAVGDTQLAALLDRLGTRLGRSRVRRLAAGDSHIPEQAAFELPIGDAPPPIAWPAPEPGEPPLRPLHLFDPPQRIEVLAEVPDGPPRRFRWRRVQHDVTRFEGPERIAAEWWRRRDGQGLTRDYYRVEDARGRRFWLFRHGLYGTEKPDPAWYVHGLFA
ncbi:Y-family DNA polymerase [Polymorphobacter fuscus]|uniref:DNA polymerase Y family protein n=1 Tax=Sandarakinorhabdus fusca TaxID=1439888 RepID=A0A7C9GQW6_9SPHN|nr:DNA polymerase Y family protein [Polymorphobacter fuscus]KAB7645641.1 DNA polymerase Y family protein [Polymorphobacter fuscus]MQT17970.1 DNA polymerase Y family protein [Polymorphobacter fuscus]